MDKSRISRREVQYVLDFFVFAQWNEPELKQENELELVEHFPRARQVLQIGARTKNPGIVALGQVISGLCGYRIPEDLFWTEAEAMNTILAQKELENEYRSFMEELGIPVNPGYKKRLVSNSSSLSVKELLLGAEATELGLMNFAS